MKLSIDEALSLVRTYVVNGSLREATEATVALSALILFATCESDNKMSDEQVLTGLRYAREIIEALDRDYNSRQALDDAVGEGVPH